MLELCTCACVAHCTTEVYGNTYIRLACTGILQSLFVSAKSNLLFQPCLLSIHQIHAAPSTRGIFPKDLRTSEAKKAPNQTSCIPRFGQCGIDMKAAPAFLHAGCFHSPSSGAVYSPAWQISAGCLVFSHHHSSPGELDAAVDAYVTRGKERGRQRERG